MRDDMFDKSDVLRRLRLVPHASDNYSHNYSGKFIVLRRTQTRFLYMHWMNRLYFNTASFDTLMWSQALVRCMEETTLFVKQDRYPLSDCEGLSMYALL